MARDRTATGIDIGSSKITTLIATVQDDGEARIIGVSTVPSRGLRKGQIVNIEEATAAISSSLEAAERMAGVQAGRAFITIGGSHIASLNSHGVVAVADPDKEITESDVKRVIDAAKAVSLPSSREILHIIPRGYVVDGQEGIVDPLNMTGVRLEVDTHLITGGSIAIRNLYKCVEDLGVDVGGIVFGGLAASLSALTDTEKELGVVLVDIGGGTTDIAIYVEGALSYSSVIPVGAINITKDIAAGLRVSLESAEAIKLLVSRQPRAPMVPEEEPIDRTKKIDKSDELDISALHLPEEIRTVSRKMLVDGIIKPRLNELFAMVGMEIKKSGFGGMTPSGIVVTGGGAQTVQIIETARRNLAMSVHVGIPKSVSGLIDEITTPAFASSIGLILYGLRGEKSEGQSFLGNLGKVSDRNGVKSLATKVIDLVKSFLP